MGSRSTVWFTAFALLSATSCTHQCGTQAGASGESADESKDAPATMPPDKPGCAKQIAVRGRFACAIYGEGEVACWIYDPQAASEKLGFKPKKIQLSDSPATQLYVDGATLCAKNTRNELWCVGSNAQGIPSSNVERNYSSIPVKHALGDAAKIEDLDPAHQCALDDGKVLCWREQAHLDSRSYDELPGRAKQLVTGINHLCVLLVDGQMACAGSNREGQLGNPSLIGESEAEERQRWAEDVYVRPELEGKVTQIAAGSNHSCALLDGGSVWCWGQNFAGEVGNGEVLKCDVFLENCDPGPVFRPTRVQGVPNVTQISAGGHSTCAVDHDGKVWCWGDNELRNFVDSPQQEGRLTRPTLIPLPERMTEVRPGARGACAQSVNQHVYCWGDLESWLKTPVRIALECASQ